MIIKNATVFQADGRFQQQSIYINNGLIVNECMYENDNLSIDATDLLAIPGLVDIHFHGCNGADFCDGTIDALNIITKYELSAGVTSLVPATMTLAEDMLGQIMECASAFDNSDGAVIRGINMEGPFISPMKKGAQNQKYIVDPDVCLFRHLQSKARGLIKFCDIAPEQKNAQQFIRELKDEVTISIAHTNADYQTACRAFENGASHVTHLYNAMPSLLHREPGVIGAAFDHKNVYVELICDGIHVAPSVVRATFAMFGDGRICFVSDSMRATGLRDGRYTLGGQDVTVNGNKATLDDGTIAGSVTNLMDCLKIAVKDVGIPLGSALKCATVNPAKAAGIFDVCGDLSENKRADILLVDSDLNVKAIVFNGILLE